MRLLYLLGLLALPHFAGAQARLNLSFEPEVNRRQPLLLWSTRGTGEGPDAFRLRLDTTTSAAHGRGSVLLDGSRLEEPAGGALYTTIAPLDSMRGQTVTISAQLRTENFTGKAYLYAYAQAVGEGSENLASHDNFNTPPVPVTAGWQRVQIQLPVAPGANRLLLGLRFQGRGRVWLDDVRVAWNQGRYHDQLLPGTEPLVLSAAARRSNWDFERPLPVLPDPRYLARPDSTSPAHHGRRSLLLSSQSAAGAYAYLGQVLLDSTMRGKTLVVQGYVRGTLTPASTLTYTLLAETNQVGGRRATRSLLQELPLKAEPASAAAPAWRPFRVAVPITWNEYFTQLAVGVHLGGPGSLGLDDVHLLVDGKTYTPSADPAVAALPTPAELAWLRQAARPLRTVVADGNDTKDLAAVAGLAANAQIIGLGDATHGSREIARFRHRLLRYLVEQKGVRALVLEADMAACLALNDYLQTGRGHPAQLLASLGTYNSAETLALVQWLRAHNERAASKIQLWGLECQRPAPALAWLRELLPERATALHTRLNQLAAGLTELAASDIRRNPFTQPNQPAPQLTAVQTSLRELRAGLEEHNRLIGTAELTLGEMATQRQLLQALEQYVTRTTLDPELAPAYQAACRAENIYWCRTQSPGGKLAVLAHNNVVAATSATGQRLRATYGPEYLALGTMFAAGSFRADDGRGGGFTVASAPPAPVGSYEYYFQEAKLPLSYLDLRAPALLPGTQWLYQNLLLRDTGPAPSTGSFLRHDLRREFDAVLFIPVSTPVQAVK